MTRQHLSNRRASTFFALHHGADLDRIGKAVCRDGEGRAIGPIGKALNAIREEAKS